MESLFAEPTEAAVEQDRFALADEQETPTEKAPRPRTRKSIKNFTSDLDSLLAEALAESIEEPAKVVQSEKEETKPKRRPITISGLDALIRKTVDIGYADQQSVADQTKRLTIRVKRANLEKLKEIARTERSYLKDILGQLISDYINKHETENF